VRFTGASVIMIGFFAILAGVIFQRTRQALLDRRDAQSKLGPATRRLAREVVRAAGAVLVLYIAYKVIERR
jgi:hypothetical protein